MNKINPITCNHPDETLEMIFDGKGSECKFISAKCPVCGLSSETLISGTYYGPLDTALTLWKNCLPAEALKFLLSNSETYIPYLIENGELVLIDGHYTYVSPERCQSTVDRAVSVLKEHMSSEEIKWLARALDRGWDLFLQLANGANNEAL